VDGIHDTGGMQGFGFGMSLTLWATGGPIGGRRPQVERIETGRYLASSYYERWEHALEVMLAERGVLTPAEVGRMDQPWDAFRDRLKAAIADHPDRPYYDSWMVALEQLTGCST
jgi:hypothetical protein